MLCSRLARLLVVALFAAAIPGSPRALAGPINPPAGPVAPTGKTLTEVEPRTPISAATTPGNATALFRITQPGSYYLTGNIAGEAGKHGIVIASSRVTLDLSGFSLSGVPNSLDGVHAPVFVESVVVRNGHIGDWGGGGIVARFDTGRIEGVTSDRNGGWGIDNAVEGTHSTHIISCEANHNGVGGIRGGASSLVSGCVARGNVGTGIAVGVGGAVEACVVRATIGSGIVADSNSLITGNTVSGSTGVSGDGILLSGSGNRVESNNVTNCARFGYRANGVGNFIVKNSARANAGGNYSFGGVQTAGPIITATGTIADSVSPWANFSF